MKLVASILRLAVLPFVAGVLLVVFTAAPARSLPCSTSLLFQPQSLIPTAHQPVEIAVADFNGDGIPDVVVTDSYLDGSGSGKLSLFLGQGSDGVGIGRFLPRVDIAVGGQPLGILVGDFNSDGVKDLAVGNWGSNAVTILLGHGTAGVGDGTFGLPVNYPAGSKPYELVSADFNGDGIADLAVCDNGETSVKVLLGQGSSGHGDGTFGAATSFAISQLSTAIAAGDLNGDGITDLVATENYGGSIALLIGQGSGGVGNGTFAPAQHLAAGTEPYDVALGDFNADGRLDIAVSNGNAGGLSVMLGVGGGAFSAANVYALGMWVAGVAVADFDQDGIADLVITSSVGNTLGVLHGLGSGGIGNGTFGPLTTVADCCFPVHPVAADLNGNGLPDVITANHQSDAIGVFLDPCSVNPLSPTLNHPRDVPNDQGGKLFLTWLASSLDAVGGPVNGYRVWRRIPASVADASNQPVSDSPLAAVRSTHEIDANGVMSVVYWEALATLPAQRLLGYGYTASTPQDSMAGSNPYSVFYITATTSNIDVFYDSSPDSGYSVDNLSPASPSAFAAQFAASGVALHWGANHESDFSGYRLYRGTDPGFIPSPSSLLSAQPDTGFFDPSGDAFSVYKLAATDVHGNLSSFAVTQLNLPTPVEVSLSSAEATSDHITLVWYVALGSSITVFRSEDGIQWATLVRTYADGTGRVTYEDRAIRPGASYHYRIGVDEGTTQMIGGETVVQVPALQLALSGAVPNPLAAGARFVVAFQLPTADAASLEVFDASGRRVAARDVGDLGPGSHRLNLDDGGRFRAGLYLVRLRQAGRVLTARAVVLR